MAGLGLGDSDQCWRCDDSCCTLLYMLYSCLVIDFLWSKMISFINTLMSSTLIQQPMFWAKCPPDLMVQNSTYLRVQDSVVTLEN